MDEAVAQMRERSPDVVLAALRVRASQGDLRTARAFPNPTLSVAVGNFALGQTNPHGLSAGDTVVVQGGVAQELVLWGKRPAKIAQATNAVSSSEAARADLDRTATFEVRRRFLAVLVDGERARLARENLDRYRDTVRVATERARSGDLAPTEADKIALEQRGFEHELADAELDRRQAVADLVPLLGIDADDVDAVGSLALPPSPTNVDDLVAGALDKRPDLHAAQADVAAADAALTLAHAEAWPNPTVGVGYTHSQFTVSGDLPDSIGANLSVPIPVANRNEGAIEHAEADALAAREAERKLRLTIPQEVRAAVASYASARARIDRFEHGFLAQAAKARRAAEVSYRDGAISLLEFLEAERTDIETQRDHLDALKDGHTAAYDVVRAAALEVGR
jgi:cobalt-zinc-cadmium efflux system outer membrane protein